MIRQAVILAGGRGTRLKPLTDTMPKPMALVNGRPFLEYIIELLKENGIKEIVICAGYMHEKITGHFGDGSRFGVKIIYSIGDVSFETGKRLKDAEKLLDDRFLLLYCDNYWPLRLGNLVELYERSGTLALITVYTNKKNITKNNVNVENGIVKIYDKSRTKEGLNGVDIGFFIFDRSILDLIGNENCSFEEKVFPILVEKGQFTAFLTDHKYYSISTPERLKDTEVFLRPKKIIFLDRDGVINKKAGKADYIKNANEFELLPGVAEAIGSLKDSGFTVIIITNQPGVARGVMSEKDLSDIHEKMQKLLHGAIDAVYTCIHGWDDGCNCRKPKAGLFFDAADDLKIDLTKSFYIGDDERDLIAGETASCRTIKIESNTDGLLEASNSILSGE